MARNALCAASMLASMIVSWILDSDSGVNIRYPISIYHLSNSFPTAISPEWMQSGMPMPW